MSNVSEERKTTDSLEGERQQKRKGMRHKEKLGKYHRKTRQSANWQEINV